MVTDATDAEVVRLIEPDGTPVASSGQLDGALEELLGPMCETMIGVRLLDEELVNLQRQGQLALYPSCRGQEAAQVGCACGPAGHRLDLPPVPRARDVRGPGDRPRGRRAGLAGGVARRVRLHRAVRGPDLHPDRHPGAARRRARRWPRGGSATAASRWPSSATAPPAKATCTRRSTWPPCAPRPACSSCRTTAGPSRCRCADQCRAATLADKAIGYGMPGVRVDGNDVAACYVVVAEAAARARAGGGPTSSRRSPTGWARTPPPTTPSRYRSDDEVAAWDALDPIDRCRALPARAGRLERRARGPGPRARHGDADPVARRRAGRPRPVPAGALRPRLLDAQPRR